MLHFTERELAHLRENVQRLVRNFSVDANGRFWDEARKISITERTFDNWIKGRNKPRSDAQVRDAARILRTTLDQLVVAPTITRAGILDDCADVEFQRWDAIAYEVDENLMTLARWIPADHIDELLRAHQSHAENVLRKYNLSLDKWTETLSDEGARQELVASLPEPDLTITLDGQRKGLVYRLASGASVPIKDPLLLWDCPCDTPREDGAQPECKIHNSSSGTLGKDISHAFSRGSVEIVWNDLRFRWTNRGHLWPPSIDSFVFMETMRAYGWRGRDYPRVLDIGSGTGFLGIAVAATSNVKEVVLTDWLLSSSLYGAVNWTLNQERLKSARLDVKVGPTIGQSFGPIADLVVCNPPYLPLLPGFEHLRRHSAVAGTELLSFVIRNAGRLGRTLLVQYSDLVTEEDLGLAAPEPVSDNPIEVAFRVTEAWGNEPYFKILKRRLEYRAEERHAYWHKLQLYAVPSA